MTFKAQDKLDDMLIETNYLHDGIDNSEIQEIIPNLYVGDEFSVRNMSSTQQNTIKRIVNTACEIGNIANYPADFYHHIKLKDDCTFEDLMTFNDSIKPFLAFMEKKSLEDSPVLIHCQMGVSRSCSMLAVYLLHKRVCKTFDEAVDYIVAKRPQAFDGGNNRVYALPIIEHFE